MATSTRKPKAARPATAVELRLPGDTMPIKLRAVPTLKALAWRWNYALQNRSRWASRGEAAKRQRDEVRELVTQLGLTDAALTRIVDSGLVEVSVPFQREDEGWEFRIFPWEYVLATATRSRRMALQSELTVVRHLDRGKQPKDRCQDRFLYVESAPPGTVAERYDFADERRLARSAAESAGLEFVSLPNPLLSELAETVARLRPRIIHLAGVDNHQARAMRHQSGDDSAATAVDGYYMRNDRRDGRGAAVEVGAVELARALCADGTRPELVCFNLYNSAARMAALCVAEGAGAAIGFQDSFDDALAELFFSTLYRAWNLAQHDVTSAFRYAWQQLREQGRRITGTGLVLWNAESIASAAGRTAAVPDAVATIAQRWREGSASRVTPETARNDLRVTVDEVKQLNYSMLHNNRPLFNTFRIAKRGDDIGAVHGIEVNVELHVGRDSYPYRLQVEIPDTLPSIDIADRIRVSLASTLSRAVRESIHTSLLIEVSFQDTVLFRETRRVTLLPIDEWEDSDANRKWLPSFVLPRDPAVARVIDAAQRYLQALRDDPTAGFDGYQSVLIEDDKKRRRFDCSGVDRQVQAIWCALLYELPLSYINPPPTFTDASQRLRSPSEVVDGRRGTCIDLALLLASCLEYVDIYPTIVLLQDHAFPCYWRAAEHFNDFALAHSDSVGRVVAPDQAGAPAAPLQPDSWYFVKDHFREIMGEIAAGRLVPLEATCLCWRNSFAQAAEQGRSNLARRSRFDSMLDIRAARIDEDAAVTPLPMLRGEN